MKKVICKRIGSCLGMTSNEMKYKDRIVAEKERKFYRKRN